MIIPRMTTAIVIDSNLKVIDVNPSFYKTFCFIPQDNQGTLIYNFGNGQWNIPKLRELLEQALTENSVYNNFEMEYDFETIGKRNMLLNARQIGQGMGKIDFCFIAKPFSKNGMALG